MMHWPLHEMVVRVPTNTETDSLGLRLMFFVCEQQSDKTSIAERLVDPVEGGRQHGTSIQQSIQKGGS